LKEVAVDELLLGGWDPELRLRMMVAAQYDAPAYIRRARAIEGAIRDLFERCRHQRKELLFGVRLHLAEMCAGVDSLRDLRSLLADDGQIEVLRQLHEEAGDPEVAVIGRRTTVGRRRALRRLRASIARFNRRWTAFLEAIDLSDINQLQDAYNRFFLLEKECAVGPGRVLTHAFNRLPRLTTADLIKRLPPLPDVRSAR
jgi:hypothetical protein